MIAFSAYALVYSLNGQETPSSGDSQTVRFVPNLKLSALNLFRIQLFFHVHRSLSPCKKTILYLLKHISLMYSTTIKKSVLYSLFLDYNLVPRAPPIFKRKSLGGEIQANGILEKIKEHKQRRF